MAQVKAARRPLTDQEKNLSVEAVEMHWWLRMFAIIKKFFGRNRSFFYRNEAERYQIQSQLQNSMDRNYYFRNH